MRILFLILSLSVLSVIAQSRRVRVRPSEPEQSEPTAAPQLRAEYYAAAQEESEEEEQPQLVSRQQYARAQLRPAPASLPTPRSKSEPRAPPVQTIRNYNKLNDDGSFTFGYEAADGSFKEETRGTDCVVRGKYGYIDPDGNKREFTYVSGNPCDPNAVNQEDEELNSNQASGERENIPENIPQRPIRPLKKRPTTTLFQADYNPAEEQENAPTPAPRPGYVRPFPGFNQIDDDIQPAILRAARPKPTNPAPTQPQPVRSSVRILRPTTPELPATTFRPQLLHSEPQPQFFQTKSTIGSSPSPTTPSPNFDSNFKNFQLENNVVGGPKPQAPGKPAGSNPLYSTELVFDPATGQYQTVLFQSIPKASPFPQPAPQQLNFFPRGPFPPQPPVPVFNQQLFQQQHAQQVSQSSNLFNQQQQKAATLQRIPPTLLDPSPQKFNQEPLASVQRFPPEPKFAASQRLPAPAGGPAPPNFFFVSPDQRTNLANGQIDSFLRGHNLQF
nr:PREDICTED: vegetative cell wall protein gp1-like [Bemisia tabaci]